MLLISHFTSNQNSSSSVHTSQPRANHQFPFLCDERKLTIARLTRPLSRLLRMTNTCQHVISPLNLNESSGIMVTRIKIFINPTWLEIARNQLPSWRDLATLPKWSMSRCACIFREVLIYAVLNTYRTLVRTKICYIAEFVAKLFVWKPCATAMV